jgi:hypothetical protein
MKYILSVIILMSFVLLPANHRLMSTGDDDDYFAVATSIAYGKFPYFSDEYHIGDKMPFASVGPGVLASPFVAVFSTIDHAIDAPIVKKREKDNRYWTWSLFGFHFAAYFYLLSAVIILYETLKLWGTKHAASLSTVLILLGGGGLLIYAFRRPVMSHVFEFFTVSIALLLITLAIKNRFLKYHDEFVGVCAALLFLTRYNNLFLSLGLIGLYIYIKWEGKHQISAGRLVRILLPYCLLIFVFRILPILANGYSSFDQGYAGAVERIMPEIDPLFYWSRIGEIFLGRDMGLIYTAPVLVVAMIALWVYRTRVPKELLFLYGFCLLNLYFAIVWKSFGSYYGYRYITFTVLPLLAVPLVFLVDDLFLALGKLKVILLGLFICYIPLMSTIVFERSGKYGFTRINNSYGVDTYTQPNFHADLLLDILHDPITPITRAAESGIGSFFWGELTTQQSLQRAMLYIAPPLVFIMFLLLYRYFYNMRNKNNTMAYRK